MRRILLGVSGIVSVLFVTSVAQAQFSTQATLQCDNGIDATAKVTLTKNRRPILTKTVSCTSGQ